jgi:hypothetical protein
MKAMMQLADATAVAIPAGIGYLSPIFDPIS